MLPTGAIASPMVASARLLSLRLFLRRNGDHFLTLHTVLTVVLTSLLFFILLKGAGQEEASPISFSVFHDRQGAFEIDGALEQLQAAPTVLNKPTQRATTPFWLSSPLTNVRGGDVVQFGDKQIMSIEFWLIDHDGRPFSQGRYSRAEDAHPPFDRSSNTVAFVLPPQISDYDRFVAKVTTRASSTLTMSGGSMVSYLAYKTSHERAAATLAGGLGLLAIFSALVAFFSATPLFITFGVWLVSSIAVSAAFFEYDYLWFGQWAAPDVELRAKLLFVTFYALTTTYLFMQLFRRQLARVKMLRHFRWLISINIGLAAASVMVPAGTYLPVFWLFVALAFGTSVVAIVRSMSGSHGSTPLWYAAGWGIQVSAGLAEVFYAAGIIPRIQGLSFQSGILISCLITGLAVADTLRVERERRQTARRSAALAGSQYRRIYDTVAVGMLTATPDGRVVRANKAMLEAFPPLAMQGLEGACRLSDIVGADKSKDLLAVSSRRSTVSIEHTLSRVGNEPRTYAIDAVPSSFGIELTFNDISEGKKLLDTLKHLSEHDALTGLANRRGIEGEFARLQSRLADAMPVSVSYLDLDRFKLINEFYGHATGDAILIEVSRRMIVSAPAGAVIGRIGGDEFVLFLPGFAQADAQAAMRAVLDRIVEQNYELDGKALSISACAGVVQLTEEMSMTDVLAFADKACAIAKSKGKTIVAGLQYTEEVIREYRARATLGSEIRHHFPVERLRVYAQPIVGLAESERQDCFEMLLRVSEDKGRVISPPGKLISIAEQQGLMSDIDRFVLHKSLTHLSENPVHARTLGFLAINLSAMSLNDERFVADAIAMLGEHESVARHVMLEITESVALSDIDSTRKFVDQMRELGVRIALDDFGAGYTSFSYLKNFPASLVKIDGGFIRDLNQHPANYAITKAITNLCHELKIKVVAEWVEDIPTLLGLLEIEVDYAQGFVLSGAQPLSHWLSNRVDLMPLNKAMATYKKQAPLRRKASTGHGQGRGV